LGYLGRGIFPVLNFNLNIQGNLNEMQRLYINWSLDPGYNRPLDQSEISSGLHDWAFWRTKLNESLIVTSLFNTPFILNQQNTNFILSKDELNDENKQLNRETLFKIDPQIARFIYYLEYKRSKENEIDYNNDENFISMKNHEPPLLDPESYMFYGLPRIQLNKIINGQFTKNLDRMVPPSTATLPLNNKSYGIKETIINYREFSSLTKEVKSDKNNLVNKKFDDSSKEKNENSEKKKINSIEPIITGINVKEKVKAFEYVNKQPKLIIKTLPTTTCESNKKFPVHSAKNQISSPKKHTSKLTASNSKSPKNLNKSDDILKEDSLQSSFFNSAASLFMGN
jgi:hypothetical protein